MRWNRDKYNSSVADTTNETATAITVSIEVDSMQQLPGSVSDFYHPLYVCIKNNTNQLKPGAAYFYDYSLYALRISCKGIFDAFLFAFHVPAKNTDNNKINA